mgnify:CR=1 FL=1
MTWQEAFDTVQDVERMTREEVTSAMFREFEDMLDELAMAARSQWERDQ